MTRQTEFRVCDKTWGTSPEMREKLWRQRYQALTSKTKETRNTTVEVCMLSFSLDGPRKRASKTKNIEVKVHNVRKCKFFYKVGDWCQRRMKLQKRGQRFKKKKKNLCCLPTMLECPIRPSGHLASIRDLCWPQVIIYRKAGWKNSYTSSLFTLSIHLKPFLPDLLRAQSYKLIWWTIWLH